MSPLAFPLNVYLAAFFGAVATTFATLPLWRSWCERNGLVDDPGHRKIHDSPIALAGEIAGRLLLIHGSADDNVHVQNTMEYAEALVQAGIQFDMAIYTNRNHGIRGGNTTLHLYRRMEEFLKMNLKEK